MIYFDFNPQLRKLSRSQSWLARQSGVNLSTIKRYQERRAKGFRWSTLDKLCRALDCQPGEILFMETKKENGDEKEQTKKEKGIKEARS